jgi:hypothetical protein
MPDSGPCCRCGYALITVRRSSLWPRECRHESGVIAAQLARPKRNWLFLRRAEINPLPDALFPFSLLFHPGGGNEGAEWKGRAEPNAEEAEMFYPQCADCSYVPCTTPALGNVRTWPDQMNGHGLAKPEE